jgi:hypothetical protein
MISLNLVNPENLVNPVENDFLYKAVNVIP